MGEVEVDAIAGAFEAFLAGTADLVEEVS